MPPFTPVSARLLEHSEVQPNGCRLWTRSTFPNGYGRIQISRPRRMVTTVHRVAFETWVRPLEPGEVVDHDCHNQDPTCPAGFACWHRPCIEPTHLIGCTEQDNILRGRSPIAQQVLITHCPAGHEYSLENTYWWGGHRYCLICRRARDQAR